MSKQKKAKSKVSDDDLPPDIAKAIAAADGRRTIDEEEERLLRLQRDPLPRDRRCPRCGVVKVDSRRWSHRDLCCVSCSRVPPSLITTAVNFKEARRGVISQSVVNALHVMCLEGTMSRARLALEIGCTPMEAGRLVSGVRNTVSADVAIRLANLLERPVPLTMLWKATPGMLNIALQSRGISDRTAAQRLRISLSRLRGINSGAPVNEELYNRLQTFLKETARAKKDIK